MTGAVAQRAHRDMGHGTQHRLGNPPARCEGPRASANPGSSGRRGKPTPDGPSTNPTGSGSPPASSTGVTATGGSLVTRTHTQPWYPTPPSVCCLHLKANRHRTSGSVHRLHRCRPAELPTALLEEAAHQLAAFSPISPRAPGSPGSGRDRGDVDAHQLSLEPSPESPEPPESSPPPLRGGGGGAGESSGESSAARRRRRRVVRRRVVAQAEGASPVNRRAGESFAGESFSAGRSGELSGPFSGEPSAVSLNTPLRSGELSRPRSRVLWADRLARRSLRPSVLSAESSRVCAARIWQRRVRAHPRGRGSSSLLDLALSAVTGQSSTAGNQADRSTTGDNLGALGSPPIARITTSLLVGGPRHRAYMR